ncbi:MAG: 5-methyltetrahydropteroyltriglutamate--homocysteine S-methyltransferase [Candidatus Omnitrophota bacterium]|jgi:5-methyltetrahydropteroyltriglutamate--homocysteine methyltransferase
MQTYAYGFPRLGARREFKKAIEDFWDKKITNEELVLLLHGVEEERICFYKEYVDTFPIGEFTYYDNILDAALIFGIYKFNDFNTYFDYARGAKALELKKYFNTNYHYLLPSIENRTRFKISWNKPLFYFKTFFSFKDNPVFLVGPYTFLKLCRLNAGFEPKFNELCAAYKKLFEELQVNGIHNVHLEEPAFCLDVPQKEVKLIVKNYKKLFSDRLKVNLITYYDSVDFLPSLYDIPFDSFGLDFIAGKENLNILKKNGFPRDKKIICGVIDGRNPLRSNIVEKVKLIDAIKKASRLNEENILVSNNAPLFHLPVSVASEEKLAPEIKAKVSFARERLYELKLISDFYEGKTKKAADWCRDIRTPAKETKKVFDTLSLMEEELIYRKKTQKNILNIPLFPVTTIGSFPQDKELRKTRLEFVKGRLSLHDYDNFIRRRILEVIEKQEEIGIDVLVHGEFERTDMVEFFAQKLKGFATTESGWVISYGTRVYRPPLIYDKIKREDSLSLKEIFYAQSIAPKTVKGILTGPITILAWSYNLRNEPDHVISFELAEALNEEAKQMAIRSIRIIQIDEPAMRELAPLKNRDRDFYFSWAVRSFNIVAKLPHSIQIHTHLCYSEFTEVIEWILKMNFDVITIEAAREKAKILESFKNIKFNRTIGPGVWDIHSKYPAREKNIRLIIDKSIKIFGPESIWINPDCGLKTRKWEEINESLELMVKVAKFYRKKFKSLRVERIS